MSNVDLASRPTVGKGMSRAADTAPSVVAAGRRGRSRRRSIRARLVLTVLAVVAAILIPLTAVSTIRTSELATEDAQA